MERKKSKGQPPSNDQEAVVDVDHSASSGSLEKVKQRQPLLSVESTQPSFVVLPKAAEVPAKTPGKTKESDGSSDEIATAIALELSSVGSDEKKLSDEQKHSDEPESDNQVKKFRAKFVHTPSRRITVHVDDHTIRHERHFLKRIERHKNRRLERYCICPLTKWLLFKEKISRFNAAFLRTRRFFWILCCPPLCYIMPQVALWPPPNDYFFYVDNIPPRERKEVEGRNDAIEIAERKKKIPKILRANKCSINSVEIRS